MKQRSNKPLKSLSRLELLELMEAVLEENEQLRKENEELKNSSEKKSIVFEKAGSLAEASLALTRIFEEADKAIAIFRENYPESNPSNQKTSEQKSDSEDESTGK